MEWSAEELYARYVAALSFFNAHIEQRHADEDRKAALRRPILSQQEFRGWWAQVGKDRDLKGRWLARFHDPARTLHGTGNQFMAAKDQVEVRPAA